MNESFGGALMLRIVLVVIVLFVVFIAVSANYARAFRVKNRVIDILEQYEGYTEESALIIDNYIANSGYSCKSKKATSVADYVVDQHKDAIKSKGSIYYNVRTCIDWQFPVLNVGGTWTINGVTETIKRPSTDLVK